jgi:hypothetical protein
LRGAAARDRVAGFWRALGLVPPTEPDYLPVMLSLYARLCELENNERVDAPRAAEHWRVARKAFLWEHLLAWLPAYLTKLSETAPPFYARWSSLLQEALTEEAREIGPQGTLPLHLRAASCMSDPRGAGGGTEEFLQTLLAPARSGMLLTRSDLGRAARTLGLGSRIGERKFILKALLGQNARSTLGWLAGEAARWAKRHRAQPPVFRSVSDWWAARAENTASLLDELGATADEEKW